MTSIKKELVTYRNNRISRTKGNAAAQVTTFILVIVTKSPA
jgi:hypothetical protein